MIIFPLLVLFSHFRIFRCSSFYTTIETIHPLSDLRKITIDPGSGDIFVGGTNVVLKLNSNFEKVAEFALGPKISSKYCRPYEIKTCPNATNLDNVVSILEFLPALNQTLLCGTLEYGNCSLLTENELRPLAHYEQNYLGSDQGSIFVPFKEDGTSVYFIGTSWDGRQQLMTEEFSFKTLYQMKFSHKTAFSRKGLCDKKRKISRLKFIYGFQDDDYVYTLYLMVRVDNSRNYYETKISKVCKKDKYFGSFQELILSCEGHNIATAAYYSNEKDLFVAFGTGNQSLTAQPSSIVCKYSAKEIKNRFETSYVQCYSGYSDKKGYTPPRWSSCDNGSVCKNSPTISVTSVCSSRSLYEIQGLENTEPWHTGHTVIYRDQKRLLTSVLTQTPIDGEHPFVWVGTSDGFLIKLVIQKSGSVIYSEYDLSENRQIGIEPDVEVDSGGQNAYFLHGNKVSKFPLNSCRIYSTCGACVLKRDPLGCGWCRDSCRRKEECNTTWHNSSCPPFIHKVTPSSGPTEGGTRLTVTGENFGWSNQSAPTVRVGKTQCENYGKPYDVLHSMWLQAGTGIKLLQSLWYQGLQRNRSRWLMTLK